jgi:hypothetical protein
MQGRRHQLLPRPSGDPQTSEAGVGLLRRSDVQCAGSVHEPQVGLAGPQQAVAGGAILTESVHAGDSVADIAGRDRLIAPGATTTSFPFRLIRARKRKSALADRCRAGLRAGGIGRAQLRAGVGLVAVFVDDELPETMIWSRRAEMLEVEREHRQAVALRDRHDRRVDVTEIEICER